MSSCSDASSSDESDDECQRSTRKFQLSRMIGEQFKFDDKETLSTKWSFVLDDGMFERQANFSTPTDLWRHIQQIDSTMTKLRLKSKKGVVRLFKSECAPSSSKKSLWHSDSSMRDGGTWVVRFSRKFKQDLSDFWVNLVLAAVSESMPQSDLIAGCVFTTRKGKTEMEICMRDDPMAKSSKKHVESENQQQLRMRELLHVMAGDKTIQFSYKSHQDEKQKKRDIGRVKKVQERKFKKGGGGTWPMVQQVADPEEDEKQQLSNLKQQLVADPFEEYERSTPVKPVKYEYDTEEELVDAPPAALLVCAPDDDPTSLPPMPTLPLHELQLLQLQDLQLGTQSEWSSDDEATPAPTQDLSFLASLRSRLDSTDVLCEPSAPSASPPQPRMSEPICARHFKIDPGFEKRYLYCEDNEDDMGDDEMEEPVARKSLVSLLPSMIPRQRITKDTILAGSPPKKLAMVLGTNPPDFSSPMMKAVLWRKRPRILSW